LQQHRVAHAGDFEDRHWMLRLQGRGWNDATTML
jgi:hypothetical protein